VFANFEPVQRSEEGCDMRKFRNFNYSTYKTVLNLLEAIYLRLRKTVAQRVIAVKTEVENTLNRDSDGHYLLRIKGRMQQSLRI